MSINRSPEALDVSNEVLTTQEFINKKISEWNGGHFDSAYELSVLLSDRNFYDRFVLSWEAEDGQTISLDGLTLVVETPYSRVNFLNKKNEIVHTVSSRELPEILVSQKV